MHSHSIRFIRAAVLACAFASAGGSSARAQAIVRVPATVLQRYVGEYDQDGSTVRITLNGDTLFREVPGQRMVLHAVSETQFKMGPIFIIEFVTDNAGDVTQFVRSGVLEFRLPRKGSRAVAPPPLPKAEMEVAKSVLERYVGSYEYIPGQMSRTDLRVGIRLKGDTLIRSIGGDQVLTPISETLFRVGNTSLVTEFVVDEFGVTLIMGTGFQQLLARRTSR